MNRSRYKTLVPMSALTLLLVVLPGCSGGGGDGGGGGPTEPSIAQMGGVWSGVSTLQASTGCGCVTSLFNQFIGLQQNYTDQINQSGTSISGITTDNATGIWCEYTGTVGSASFAVNSSRCAVDTFLVQCDNGNQRWLLPLAKSAEGTVTGNSATGTAAETYQCLNSQNGAPTGTLTLRSSFTQTKG